MKILVAEDDLTSSAILEDHLRDWGYTPLVVSHGKEALQVLKGPDAPHLAVLDWMMPYLSGLELCQAVQNLQQPIPPYIILLSAKAHKQEVVRALQAGAQDYITKPFDPSELHARVDVGRRVVQLQSLLAQRVAELEATGNQLKQLRSLQPICCRCKKTRHNDGNWREVEGYISRFSDTKFSHALCPECYAVFCDVLQTLHHAA
jgi:DNA-binding response OmpR family regulator